MYKKNIDELNNLTNYLFFCLGSIMSYNIRIEYLYPMETPL